MEQTNLSNGETMLQVHVEAVTDALGTGLGSIAPGRNLDDSEARTHAEKLSTLVEAVDTNAPVVCLDGRKALKMMNGAEIKPGLKSAGGNSITTGWALEVTDAFKDGGSVFAHYARVVNGLEEAGHVVGFHTDNKKADALFSYIIEQRESVATLSIDEAVTYFEALDVPLTATGCGANDAEGAINAKVSRNPQQLADGRLETPEEITARLEHTFQLSTAMNDEPTDRADFDAIVDTATEYDTNGRFNSWHSVKAMLIADKVLCIRGVEDGVLGRTQILEDDGEGVHGHNENDVVVFKRRGVTLETSKIIELTGLKDFVTNAAEVGQQAAETFLQPTAKLAAIIYQVATKTHLSNGQQRGIILA